MIDIILVDDHDLFRMGTMMVLSSQSDYKIVAQAATGAEFFERLEALTEEPALALLDIVLPDMSGVEIAKKLRAEHPDIQILMLSAESSESTLLSLTEIGVEGFVSKNAPTDELLTAINTIVNGGTYFAKDIARLIRDVCNSTELHVDLSEREKNIIRLCCEGLRAKEISEQLNISIRTVESHKTNIFTKLGINNNVALVRYAIRRGILQL